MSYTGDAIIIQFQVDEQEKCDTWMRKNNIPIALGFYIDLFYTLNHLLLAWRTNLFSICRLFFLL